MGNAVAITRTDHTASELRGRSAQRNDAVQAGRLLAVAMIVDGASRADATRQTGMDRQTLRDWMHRYNQQGVDGLISRKAPRCGRQTGRGADKRSAPMGNRRPGPSDPQSHPLALR